MEKWKKRSVDLLTSLYLGPKGDEASVVPYYPQKVITSEQERPFFRRTTPERCGISSKRIYNMLSELETERRANVHNLMILRSSEVISECSREGYNIGVWHLSHSMSKTVTGLVIGTLFDEGILSTDMPLAKIFPEIPFRDKRFADITLEHLLTMRSGVDFFEAGAVTESLWTPAFFDAMLKFQPGTSFSYNSMNSYILARVAERLSGKSFGSLVHDRLFSPLGIDNYLWELGPEGTEKGGWGLYLSSESWAKLGLLVLRGGVFFGNRIISEEWIKRSTRLLSTPEEADSDFGYGYQIWVSERGEILFNGMLGQNVWICPENGIIAVVQSGNNELFQRSPTLLILRKYLRGRIEDSLNRHDIKALHDKERTFCDASMWVKPLRRERSFMRFLGLRDVKAFDTRWTDILGTYVFAENNIGLLPLFVRGMQNNLHSRIERLSLSREGEELYLTVTESSAEYKMTVGLYGYEETVLDFRGEKYTAKIMGEATRSPTGEREFRIEILYPELPNTRMLKITVPHEDKIRLELSELPNSRVVDEFLERMPGDSPLIGFAFGLLGRAFGDDFVTKRTGEAFSPVLIGADIDFDGYKSILDAENIGVQKRARIGRILHLIVDRIFGDEDESGGDGDKKRISNKAFLSELFTLIRAADQKEKENSKSEKTTDL